MDSKVTAIVAVYNCAAYIRQSIDSLINQTHENLEILICDDCSTDTTWDILSTYHDSRIKFFRNEKNKGVVFTRNFLLAQATGDFILIQDADDWSDKNRVKILLGVFNDKSIDVCGTSHYRVNISGVLTGVTSTGSRVLTLSDCLNFPFMPPTVMLRYTVYKKIGGYHDFFSRLFAEDLYWMVRMVEKFNVYYLSQPLYYYRLNPQSITNSIFSKQKFVVPELMSALIRQRLEKSTDWIEEGDYASIEQYKMEKLNDNVWLSEQYRVAAAVQCDGSKYNLAWTMLYYALRHNPLNSRIFRTGLYIVRRISLG